MVDFKAKVLTKRGPNAIYNTITKSWEWLTINCAISVAKKCFNIVLHLGFLTNCLLCHVPMFECMKI